MQQLSVFYELPSKASQSVGVLNPLTTHVCHSGSIIIIRAIILISSSSLCHSQSLEPLPEPRASHSACAASCVKFRGFFCDLSCALKHLLYLNSSFLSCSSRWSRFFAGPFLLDAVIHELHQVGCTLVSFMTVSSPLSPE